MTSQVHLGEWAGPDLHREEGDVVKVLYEASNLRAILLVHVEPRPSLDLHLGAEGGVRSQRSGHAP